MRKTIGLGVAGGALVALLVTPHVVAAQPPTPPTILDQAMPTTESARDALATRLLSLDDTASLAALCGVRSAGWGTAVQQAVRAVGKRAFAADWGDEDPLHCHCTPLRQLEAATITSWQETPEDDCTEARKTWAKDLREGDAIVKRLRPGGVNPWEGLARATKKPGE